jgi:hypothetical protein
MQKEEGKEALRADLEEMARDLLLLTRVVGIYPQGHPQLASMVGHLSKWAEGYGDEGIAVGVTGSELVVGGQFFGGRETRLEVLAKQLYHRNIARITWHEEVDEREVYAFARIISERELVGEEIVKHLEEQGIKHIHILPLDLDALHSRISTDANLPTPSDTDERRKRIWRGLQKVSGSPQSLGRALGTNEFWSDAFSDDPKIRGEFVELMVGLGSMLERAFLSVPEATRETIGNTLSELGQTLSVNELSRMVDILMSQPTPTDKALQALMKHVDGDKLATMLGGLASLGGAKEERVSEFVKRFIPADSVLGLVGLMSEWSGDGEKMGFSSEIWQWLESYLLDMDEDKYMGEGYRETLDRMSARLRTSGERGVAFGFFEDPQDHIDRIYACMVREGIKDSHKLLDKRLTERFDELDNIGTLELVELLDMTVPDFVQGHAEVYNVIFKEILSGVKDYSQDTKLSILAFARRHESEALESMLKTLSDDDRISVRRFLVDILSNLTTDVVPLLIRKARAGQWYFVRNVTIVLGRLRDPRSLPFLRSLLDSDNSKVRKEALRSLGQLGPRAKRDLATFSLRIDRSRAERNMARELINRMGAQ